MNKECKKLRWSLLLLLLASIVVSGCLSAPNGIPEPNKFEITVLNTETDVLQTVYETSLYRATPNGFYEKGVLKIKNSGNTTLRNVRLKIQSKRSISPAEADFLEHAGVKVSQIRLNPNLTIMPTELFIDDIQPHESQNFSIDIIGYGEGNFYGIDVVYNNKTIFGVKGFAPAVPISTSVDFTAEELADMPPEMLAEIVPQDVLERFTPDELAGFTADELAHIAPSKFLETKNQSPSSFVPQEPKKLPVAPDEVGR